MAMLKKPLVGSEHLLGNVLTFVTIHDSEGNEVGGRKGNLKFWALL